MGRLDPCCICGDTDGDCRCSLPDPTDRSWHGDHELLYAEHLDLLCDEVQQAMEKLRPFLSADEFTETIETIVKEVSKNA